MLLVFCGMCAVKACPGVCVAERIADYCEAVLDASELCKSGLRCCVSRDSYGDGELPPNLVLMDRNASHPTSGEILFCNSFSSWKQLADQVEHQSVTAVSVSETKTDMTNS